jgi:Fibrobacter succinogenes major domain (Fib_succ_major).
MKVCKFLALALFAITMSFTACGDDDSSSFVSPEKESSSSEILSSGDGTSDGNGDKSSSSVSSSTTNSSSSAKSSSSTDSKSSSSVTSSSSGGDDFLTLLVEDPIACDDEGKFSEIVYEKVPYRVLCQNGYLVYAPQSSSSSSFVKSSSSYFNMSKQYNEKRTYGTFVDPRDNQEYRTIVHEAPAYNLTFVVFATNLNYGKMVTAETATYSDETVEKFCYNDDPWYCENGFGGLYTWSEAMGLPRACDTVALGSTPECPDTISDADEAQRQGICPEGWHVMNGFEWRRMPTSEGFGAKPMLSQVFRGSDDIGLAVLLGGMSDPDLIEKKYGLIGQFGFYWVAEEKDSLRVGVVSFTETNVKFSDSMNKPSVLSVRCVKDY